MAIIIRVIVIALVAFIFYKVMRYILDPKRKLDEAYAKGEFYIYDDVKDIRKNFFISYKGALFEGEKYLGTTDHSFDVVSIFISVRNLEELQGFTIDDFEFLQKEVLASYPHAKISWVEQIEELLKNGNEK